MENFKKIFGPDRVPTVEVLEALIGGTELYEKIAEEIVEEEYEELREAKRRRNNESSNTGDWTRIPVDHSIDI